MTTKGGSQEPERPQPLPAKAASADLGMLVDQLVKLARVSYLATVKACKSLTGKDLRYERAIP
jgi:hypothetical protein